MAPKQRSKKRLCKSASKKKSLEISDPIFKLPLEYGWKRELVYRKAGGGSVKNSDIYYYTPENKKLRSIKQIQKYLNRTISNNSPLTIKNFSLIEEPIGINDYSKEIVRHAGKKMPKEASVAGNNTTKQLITPDENNEDPMKFHDASIAEYLPHDISVARRISMILPSELNESVQNNTVEWNAVDLLQKPCDQNPSIKSSSHMLKLLPIVFMHLDVHDLLAASHVCTAWRDIAMSEALWQNVCLKNSIVCDWKSFVDTINDQGTVSLDTRDMLIPDDPKEFWLSFCKNIRRAVKIKTIDLCECPTHIVESLICNIPQLEVLKANYIKNLLLTKDIVSTNNHMNLNLNSLTSLKNLTEIQLKGLSGIRLVQLPSFKNLIHLKTLSLTSIESFPKHTYQAFDTITTNLENFALGDCNCLSIDFAASLRRLYNLKSLRLENCCGADWNLIAQDVCRAIKSLDKLCVLELINIDFNKIVKDQLEKCCDLRVLLIIPNYLKNAGTSIQNLMDCLQNLSLTLSQLIWGFTYDLLNVTNRYIAMHNQPSYNEEEHTIFNNLELPDTFGEFNSIPLTKFKEKPKEDSSLEVEEPELFVISIYELAKTLETMMVRSKIQLIKVDLSSITKIYASNYVD